MRIYFTNVALLLAPMFFGNAVWYYHKSPKTAGVFAALASALTLWGISNVIVFAGAQ